MKLSPERRNQIRHEAREACAALLMVNLQTGDGDLFVMEGDGYDYWTDDEKAEFEAEVERVINRIRR